MPVQAGDMTKAATHVDRATTAQPVNTVSA